VVVSKKRALSSFEIIITEFDTLGAIFKIANINEILSQSVREYFTNVNYCKEIEKSDSSKNRLSMFEEFSDEKYEQAIKNKEDVIIFWDPEKYVDRFQDEIATYLQTFERYQKMLKGRKSKVLVLRPKSAEDIKKFQEKYQIQVKDDTILLLRNKYLRSFYQFDAEHYFQRQDFIFKYFRKMQKLDSKKWEEFAFTLPSLNSEGKLILCYAPKDSANYKRLRNRFAVMTFDQNFAENKNLHYLLITDKEVAQKLNLDVTKEGDLFLLSKANKYNHRRKTTAVNDVVLNIVKSPKGMDSPLDEILVALTLAHKKNYVFTSQSFDVVPTKYSLVLEVDHNRIEKSELNRCIQAFSDLHTELLEKDPSLLEEVSLVRLHRKRAKGVYSVYIRDDEMTMKELAEAQRTTKNPETIEKVGDTVESHSYLYEFPEDLDLNKENLHQFIKDVKAGKVKEFFKSQPEPRYQKYSKKIVADTFKREILDSDKHNVMFFYSKHCHACKQYGGFYEELALENLRNPRSDVQFNRMNSDLNQLSSFPNYHYTPIFMVIRKEDKTHPFLYKSPFFRPELLKNFIDITLDQELISRDVEKKLFSDLNKSKNLIKNLKLEEIKQESKP